MMLRFTLGNFLERAREPYQTTEREEDNVSDLGLGMKRQQLNTSAPTESHIQCIEAFLRLGSAWGKNQQMQNLSSPR